jgi:hypothetical protein
MGYEPALSAGVSSPGSSSQQFDYSSAIDPALEAVVPPPVKSGNMFEQSSSGMPSFREDLKREVQSASPYSSGASDSLHLRGGGSFLLSPSDSMFSYQGNESNAYANSPAKLPTTIDELLALGGSEPPTVPGKSQEPEFIDELRHLYHSIYAVGLESFLESKWFTVKGVAKLMSDNKLLEQCGTLLTQFAKTPADDGKEMAYASSVEARVVWGLACMVRDAASESLTSNGVKPEGAVTAESGMKMDPGAKSEPSLLGSVQSEGGIPAADDAVQAGNRLTVFENLLCGVVAERNVLTKPVPGNGDPHRSRELEFWYNLGNFVTLNPATSAKEMDDILSILRNLLDGRENRDVIYSIAVVRAYSNRVAEYSEQDRPLHLDETDVRSKLHVAKKFLRDEADGNGTTNVIRRLCELVARTLTN